MFLSKAFSFLTANEIIANASAWSSLIRLQAEAGASKTTENATIHGLIRMYDRLQLTEEQHQLSLYWINTLEKLNLVDANAGYTKQSHYTG